MATINYVVLKHHRKADGTYNVKLRVTQGGRSAYIATNHFIDDSMLGSNMQIRRKHRYLLDQIETDVVRVRRLFSTIGMVISRYTAKELAKLAEDMLTGKNSTEVDFFAFAQKMMEQHREKKKSVDQLRAAMKHMRDYNGGDQLNINDITIGTIRRFSDWMDEKIRKEGKGAAAKIMCLKRIKQIIEHAKDEYNDEDRGIRRITVDPFRRFTIGDYHAPAKRGIPSERVREILQMQGKERKGMRLMLDVFAISFLLAGANPIDIYTMPAPVDGRIVYQRTKTRGKREDNAEISIKVEPELRPYLERYKDPTGVRAFRFYREKSYSAFYNVIRRSVVILGERMGIECMVMYHARRSWATIARNECRLPMDDVAFCLNHHTAHRVTEVYVEKDWGILDRANRMVIEKVLGKRRLGPLGRMMAVGKIRSRVLKAKRKKGKGWKQKAERRG